MSIEAVASESVEVLEIWRYGSASRRTTEYISWLYHFVAAHQDIEVEIRLRHSRKASALEDGLSTVIRGRQQDTHGSDYLAFH